MKRKRSTVSHQPRANADTLFQSYFGQLSPVEPFGKQAENENVKEKMDASAGLETGNKLKKLKLKFRGVTHTIHAKSKTETGFSSDSLIKKISPCSDCSKPQDDTDGNYVCPFDKRKGLGNKLLMPSVTESGFTAENHSHRGKTTGETIDVNHEHVCESKHITRRCALSVEFSDEDNKDAELHFLKDPGIPGSIKYGKMKLKSGKKYEDSDYVEEDPTSSDESISAWKKPKRESVDLLVQRGNHTCSVDSLKDVLSGSAASIADISDALVPMGKGENCQKWSNKSRKLRLQRRKIQSEKAAREAEAAAIRKILGQESGRKKREDKMKKHRDEFVKEKSNKSFNLGSNTVRLTMRPQGTVVTFSEDIGLPSIFQMGTNREKCSGPNCTDEYKYRDSKSK
ncbi:hypothetical protein GmHk_17G047752 [Glycine max]|nr:hypothetical protein GmHk_17G047752 [Glycine max]